MKDVIGRNYQTLIFEFRGNKVIMDFHLASLYNVETKQLKRQVKRNIGRFPDDFMFELTKDEFDILRRQIGTSSWGGSRIPPMAFTEQGVAMLSSVLSSEKAIQINIEIMRAFSKYRALLRNDDDLKEEIKNLDDKLNHSFRFLLDKIDALHQKQDTEKPEPIGYKIKKK
ncbi:MAG: ORF6N domain-containing protein [Daejeonella sp.]